MAAILDLKRCQRIKFYTPSGKCWLGPIYTQINHQKKSVLHFHLLGHMKHILPDSQADWCNNCGFIHRSMKFSACLDNVPRQIYSYGANRNNVYVSLGSYFTKWLPKAHCGRIVFSIMRQNQLLLNDSTYPNSRQCAWNNL